MGPIAAVKSVLRKYVQFNGRAAPSEFWWWNLVYLLVICGLYYPLFVSAQNLESTNVGVVTALSLVLAAVSLGTLVPHISVAVRRLHDTGRSGAWYFIMFVPLIGQIWFLVLMLLPSSQFKNDYGDPPGGQAWARTDVSNEYVAAFTTDPRQAMMGKMATTDAEMQSMAQDFNAHRKAEISEYYKTKVLGGLSPKSS